MFTKSVKKKKKKRGRNPREIRNNHSNLWLPRHIREREGGREGGDCYLYTFFVIYITIYKIRKSSIGSNSL